MQTSVIRRRVADFLQRFPPFDSFLEPDLLELAGSGRVKFHESGEYIFRQGDAKGKVLWMMQQGRVELLNESAGGEQLRDVLGEGDLLGMDRFIGDGCCLSSARTASDVILYGVDAALLESLISRYPVAKRFLNAHISTASTAAFGRISWLDAEPPPAEFLRARFGALAGTKTAAAMEGPITTRAAVGAMLNARGEALAITSNGTTHAVLTAQELALFCGHNPALLIAMIRDATSIEEIVPLLHRGAKLVVDALSQPRDVDDCRHIAMAINGALAETCVRLAKAEAMMAGLRPPEVACCWFSFGESARCERLDRALLAIAVVYEDEDSGPGDAEYFGAVTQAAAAMLSACGVHVSNVWPEGWKPCMPLSGWTRLFSDTLHNPIGGGLYARCEFFDTRPIGGSEAVLRRVRGHIYDELQSHSIAIPLLANDTLANMPPLTFFRGFVLDLDGAQRDSFDMGRAAISPIAAAARVFAMAQGRIAEAGTLERLHAAAGDYPECAQLLHDAAVAFRVAVYYQAVAGDRIQPDKLGKFDQRLLKTAFSSILRLLEFTSARFVPSL